MIKRLIEKLKTLRLYFVIYSIFKRNKSDFYKDLMKDWGKEDVYGPWTKHKNDGKLCFYKSYYMIDGGGTPKIDLCGIFCDDCGEEIRGLYEDHKDGTYTCVSCDLKRQDGADIDNCMGCDW